MPVRANRQNNTLSPAVTLGIGEDKKPARKTLIIAERMATRGMCNLMVTLAIFNSRPRLSAKLMAWVTVKLMK